MGMMFVLGSTIWDNTETTTNGFVFYFKRLLLQSLQSTKRIGYTVNCHIRCFAHLKDIMAV